MRGSLGLLVLLALCAQAQGQDDTPWFQRALIGIEVGPTGAQWGSDPRDVTYASQFNGAEIMAQQIAMGSEYLVLWARDHEWAYYNSKLMPKCPGLGERDPLREALDAKPRVPLIAYCVVQAGGHALREHPEWGMVGADGNRIEGRMCLNSPYRNYVHGLLEEMIAYGIDGFHVDMVDQGFGPPYGCWCEHCKALFNEMYPGEAMPAGATWDAAWERFLNMRYETSARFERDTMAFVKSRAPKMTVDFNYHGYPPFSFEVGQRPVQHAGIGDFVTCETGVWGFSALSVGLTAEFVRAATPGRRYQVVMQRGARIYHDQTTRPLNDMRWEMFNLLMHGAQVTIVDKTPFEGQIDPVAYGRMRKVFEEVNAKRELFGGTPVYDVGLYYSSRTRDWWGRDHPEKYNTSFNGAYKALVYEHLTTGVVLDENLSLETLKPFPVVVLSDVAIISPEEVAVFKQWVETGGVMVITGNSGTLDRYGNATEEAPLEELVGAKRVRVMADNDNYVAAQPGEEWLQADAPPATWPQLIYGPAVVYEGGGEGSLIAPIRTHRQLEGKEGTTSPSPAGEPVGPARIEHAIGAGKVVTLAASPGFAAGGEYRTVEARKLLSRDKALRPGENSIAVSAPAFVESYVTKDGSTCRIHFTSYISPPGSTDPKRPWSIPELMVDEPMYKASVRLPRGIGHAEAAGKETALAVNGDTVELTISNLHEVLTIEAAP